MGSNQLSDVMATVSKYVFNVSRTPERLVLIGYSRDPKQHATLRDEIEHQSTALYSTGRLWDDGIIKPTDTRDVLGLALGVVSPRSEGSSRPSTRTAWDGNNHGFGVFRM